MKRQDGKSTFAGLLLLTLMSVLAAGCATGGASSQGDPYGYGYPGAYDPAYYRGDAIYADSHPPVVVVPPGHRPGYPPAAVQLPARPVPRPAPRAMGRRR